MIPFASQRGLGQDLAAHLLNSSDNEYMEVADLRGAVADDLQGAFAEWEAQAAALTKCKNYLYSLSVNPDQSQGHLSRDQYLDYIDRVEDRLGLTNQPRAVVFHIKDGREHAHVVWSRVDAVNEKAIHMAFDHDKLMMVTREFARDHDLKLPAGYNKEKGAQKTPQATLYDMAQKRQTGLSKQDHIDKVSSIWSQSDSPKAFVNGLAANGYMLATGKRPYVVVDFYGGIHALPRLIADKSTRAKDIRAFLENEYPSESLPTVEESKTLIAEYRKSIKVHVKQEHHAENLERLKHSQQKRRAALENEAEKLWDRHRAERADLAEKHLAARGMLRQAYRAQERAIHHQREVHRPRGLADFLGRITGVNLIRKKLHQLQDKVRYEHYQSQREDLKMQQRQDGGDLHRLQALQGLRMQGRISDFKKVVAKEKQAIEEMHKKESRISARAGGKDMPSLGQHMTPRGRKAMPHKAKTRHYKPVTAKEVSYEELQANAHQKGGDPEIKPIELAKEFNERSSDVREGEEDSGSSGEQTAAPARKKRTRKPRKERKRGRINRTDDEEKSQPRTRRRDLDPDRGR